MGTERIPDPTTAGDFCRRFGEADIRSLVEAADEARLNVWARQPATFFERATIDMGGTLPAEGRWREKREAEKARILRMEFKTFLNAFIKIPCQIVRAGRQLIYRVLSYHPHLPVFFRLRSSKSAVRGLTSQEGRRDSGDNRHRIQAV